MNTLSLKSPLKLWLMASRPKTLWASIAPVAVGSMCAIKDGFFEPFLFLVILLCALLIQIASNLANDVYDFEKGADQPGRTGPTRVTQAGLISPKQMKSALGLVLFLSLLLGGYLVYRGGVPILIIGLLSLIFSVAYSAGPFPLAYVGLGEIFVLIFFGPVAVAGTYYLFSGEFDAFTLWIGLACGFISSAILVVNNLRDIDNDRCSGKLTLAARFGPAFARIEYVTFLTLAALIPLLCAYFYSSKYVVLISSLFLLPALPLIRSILAKTEGQPLNQVLAGTSRLLLIFSSLFAISCLP